MIQFKNTNLNRLDALKHEITELDREKKLFPIGMKICRIGQGVLTELPEIIRKVSTGNRLLMVTDATLMLLHGDDLKAHVEKMLEENGFALRRLIVTGHPDVHADEETIGIIKGELHDLDAVVVVGSGTITDSTKDATFQVDREIPLICVQTADSVTAFSDNLAVVLRDGVKRTIPSRWPDALIIDSEIIRESPREMTIAGYCDLMAMYTAPADWRLSYLTGMTDLYDEIPQAICMDGARDLMLHADGMKNGDLDTLDKLSTVLTLGGFSMALINTTAVGSGTEHVISHMLDMQANLRGEPLALHGEQVAVSAIIAAAAWEKLFQSLDPSSVDLDACFPSAESMQPVVLQAFADVDPSGKVGVECWNDYSAKLSLWNRNRETFRSFLEHWDKHKEELRTFVSTPEEIAHAVSVSGAPMKYSELKPVKTKEVARWAIYNCHLMRNRFCVVDLLCFLGLWNEQTFEELLLRAASVGGGL